MSFEELSRADLAVLVPELLLCGQLIDRSGMAHLIVEFGREGMAEVAIEEWQASSPWYTRRMQQRPELRGRQRRDHLQGPAARHRRAAAVHGLPVPRRRPRHGEFWLDHCGALMDVEPMGDEFVTAMCHDIEDPTFDATALATNPHAQVRPSTVHRACPPTGIRTARGPSRSTRRMCHRVVQPHTEPDRPDRRRRGGADPRSTPAETAGRLLGSLALRRPVLDFSRSALVRIAEEVCLQHHLLALGFLSRSASGPMRTRRAEITRKQLTGIAGLAAERIRDALGLPDDLEGLAAVLSVHPLLRPNSTWTARSGSTADAC